MKSRFSVNSFKQPWLATHILILGFAAAKLAVAPLLPLSPYEAHYALYGFYLDWSYVDHPPLVGWLQGLMLNFAASEFALRLIPIILSATAQYLLATLALRLYPDESPWLGFISVLLLQGAAISHLALGMVPEVPLVTLSVATVWLTQRVLEHNHWRAWLALGIILGLAGLSKYTAVTLVPSVALALLFAHGSRFLIQLRSMVAALLALVIISPVLIWNWQHEWLSFRYQSTYQLERNSAGPAWSLDDALRAHLEQVFNYSPLIYFGGIAAILWCCRRLDPGSRLLLVFAAPVLLLFCWAAGLGGAARPHWTYVGWLLLTPLIGRGILALWSWRSVRVFTYGSACYSIIALLLLHLLLLPIGKFQDFKHPLRSMLGWKEAALRAERLRQTLATQAPADPQPVLLVRNWHDAGRLAWYARPTAVLETRNRPSQYAYWFGEARPDVGGILVVPSKERTPPKHPAPGFSCTPLDRQTVYHGPSLVNVFNFFRCKS